MITDDYLAAARAAVRLVRDPAVAKAWDEMSALAEFRVSGLVGHLSNQVVSIPDALTAPAPTEPLVPVLYGQVEWIGADLDADINVMIREGSERLAEGGADAVADRMDAAIAELPALFGDLDRPVKTRWMRSAVTVSDLLLTRLMELAVHSDDLAVSVSVETPELPLSATEAVVDLLSRLAIMRHGPVAVLRGLSRAERAPETFTAF
ncbi:maleylpyruvate isomerase N-terminal domain-containing protein [Labedaea rhizosphaerae]|uniref:Mycothiol maleylpyruvate isomerase-like protein n=1 Tax=Labedaea rhizosphaerae TaxID=598644 RepID=A0A4R6RVL7_LABRH|nr:maleylpyruvate isomerase N-terminal domain-containing protein [Labedaea rhizosphaerae]TDP91032.1 mycothiol maleylpyruvate isomerase-like protein [Labedaea rhizosphaerae]